MKWIPDIQSRYERLLVLGEDTQFLLIVLKMKVGHNILLSR
jgi:hypothetical protein